MFRDQCLSRVRGGGSSRVPSRRAAVVRRAAALGRRGVGLVIRQGARRRAAADAAAAAVGGSLPFRRRMNVHARARTTARASRRARAGQSRRLSRFFSPLADVSPGVADVLHYASWIKPGISRETRLSPADRRLALVAVSEQGELSANIAADRTPSGVPRVGGARSRVLRRAEPRRSVDAALPHLGPRRGDVPAGSCARPRSCAAGVLETARAGASGQARDPRDAATECSARAPGFREAVRSRASDADGTESSVPATVARLEKLKGPHRRRKVRFAQTPPPPRAGPCCWLERAGVLQPGRLGGGTRKLGPPSALLDGAAGRLRAWRTWAVRSAPSRTRASGTGNCLASVEERARDARPPCSEIGPWVLAVRISATTASGHPRRATARAARRDSRAAARGSAPLRRGVFREGARAEDGASSRRRGTCAPCWWRAEPSPRRRCGRRANGSPVIQAEQTCEQLRMLHAPAHCLLPAAALAVGETVARACHLGMLDRRKDRKLFTCLPRRLAVSREAPACLAADLARETQTSRAREVPLTRRAKRKRQRRRAMREDGRRRAPPRGGGEPPGHRGRNPRRRRRDGDCAREIPRSRARALRVLFISHLLYSQIAGRISRRASFGRGYGTAGAGG